MLKKVTPPFKDDRSFSRHIECPVHSFLKIQVLDATAKPSPFFLQHFHCNATILSFDWLLELYCFLVVSVLLDNLTSCIIYCMFMFERELE